MRAAYLFKLRSECLNAADLMISTHKLLSGGLWDHVPHPWQTYWILEVYGNREWSGYISKFPQHLANTVYF